MYYHRDSETVVSSILRNKDFKEMKPSLDTGRPFQALSVFLLRISLSSTYCCPDPFLQFTELVRVGPWKRHLPSAILYLVDLSYFSVVIFIQERLTST